MPTIVRTPAIPATMTPRIGSVAAAAKSEKPTNAGPGPICRLTATPENRTTEKMTFRSGAAIALRPPRPTNAQTAKATLAAAVTPTTRRSTWAKRSGTIMAPATADRPTESA